MTELVNVRWALMLPILLAACTQKPVVNPDLNRGPGEIREGTESRGGAMTGRLTGPFVTVTVPPDKTGELFSEYTCTTAGFSDPPMQRARQADQYFDRIVAEIVADGGLAAFADRRQTVERELAETYGCDFRYTSYFDLEPFEIEGEEHPVYCYIVTSREAAAANAAQLARDRDAIGNKWAAIRADMEFGSPERDATLEQQAAERDAREAELDCL